MAKSPIEFDAIARRLAQGMITIVLGEEVNLLGRSHGAPWEKGESLPLGRELADYLAERFDYPSGETRELGTVAQYVSEMMGREALNEALRQVYELEFHGPNRLHQFLTSLPARLTGANNPFAHFLLIVDLNLDDGLERAFEKSKEPYDVLIYTNYNGRPAFIHVPYEENPREIADSNSYRLSPDGRTIILKSLGGIQRNHAQRSTFVITEEDYFDYPPYRLIPSLVATKLTNSDSLYLGCSSQSQGLRVILNRFSKDRVFPNDDYRSWVVQAKSQPIESRFWASRNVQIIESPIEEFIDRLNAQIEALPATGNQAAQRQQERMGLRAGATGPLVKTLQTKLKELGFGPLTVDGSFGQQTLTALKAFQESQKLTADGIAGPKVLEALEAAIVADSEKGQLNEETEKPITESSSPTPEPADEPAPIVLVHGVLKFAELTTGGNLIANYFRLIPESLLSDGHVVPAPPRLDLRASIAERAQQLKDYLQDESNTEVFGKKVHLIAHGTGGLDCRFMISSLGMAHRVLTLTTIGTPHQGSPIADVLVAGNNPNLSGFISQLLNDQAALELTTTACQKFNEEIVDSPEVLYCAVAGGMTGTPGAQLGSLGITHDLIQQQEGDNDGFVSIASALFSNNGAPWRRDVWEDSNHFRLVNWGSSIVPSTVELVDSTIVNKYRSLANRITGRQESLDELPMVRTSPANYIGSIGEDGLHRLVLEVVDSAMTEVTAGYCDTITLTVGGDNSVTVVDNGRGLSVEKTSGDGPMTVEVAMTKVAAPKEAEGDAAKDSVKLRGSGLAVVNFLSESLHVEIWQAGAGYEQDYARGVAIGALEEAGETRKRGKQITFKPDRVIFGDIKFNIDLLAESLREKAFLNPHLRITLEDRRASPPLVQTFYYVEDLTGLIRALSSKELDARLDAIRKLGESGEPPAVKPLLAALAETVNLRQPSVKQRREAESIRAAIAEALGHINTKQAKSALFSLIADKSINVAMVAARSLEQLHERPAIEVLLPMLRASERSHALAAARVIAELTGPEEAGLLIELSRSRKKSVQSAIVDALEETHDARTTSILEPLLGVINPKDRGVVIRALGKTAARNTNALLIGLLENDDRPDVRKAAVRELARIGGDDAIDALKRTLNSGDEELAKAVQFALNSRSIPASESDAAQAAQSAMSNAYALIIAIDKYEDPGLKLQNTVWHAQQLVEVLIDPQRGGYARENVEVLINEQATSDEIRARLEALVERRDPYSNILFYFGGHAGRFPSEQRPDREFALVPADFSPQNYRAIIGRSELIGYLQRLSPSRTTVVLDCAYGGLLEAGPNWVVLASARGVEMAYEAAEKSFTGQLAAALQQMPSGDGLIRVFDLFEYLQPRVTRDFPTQHPVLNADAHSDFPIALHRGGQVEPELMDDEGFRYDAYISFVDEDGEFVRKTLIPRLNQADLRVAISQDVEKDDNVSRAANTQRGITQAKRVLLVMSPAYVQSELPKFDEALKTITDEGVHQRLVPVEFAPLEREGMPSWLSSMEFHSGHSSYFLDRVIRQLKRPLRAETLREFPSRNWALRKVNAWLEKVEPRVCLVTGAPGSGKTSLAHWVEGLTDLRVQDLAAAYPEITNKISQMINLTWRDLTFDRENSLVESLAKKLADTAEAFSDGLAQSAELDRRIGITTELRQRSGGNRPYSYRAVTSLDLSKLSPTEAFEEAWLRPVGNYFQRRRTKGTLLIVVDGIDEGPDAARIEELVNLLQVSNTLPAEVRFLLTSRRHVAVDQSFPNALKINLDNGVELEKWLTQLSPTARDALVWAESFRRATETNEVFSEYLLAGLYEKSHELTHRFLTLFADERVVGSQLEKFVNSVRHQDLEFSRVQTHLVESLSTLPLSEALEKTLAKAVSLPSYQVKAVIDEDALLLGLLAEPSTTVNAWIAERLQVPRETLTSLIEEMKLSIEPLDEIVDRIWRASSRRPLFINLTGHRDNITALEFSLDGRWLFSGDMGGIVGAWQTATGTLRKFLDGETQPVRAICALQEGRILVGWENGIVEIFGQEFLVTLVSIRLSSPISTIAVTSGEKIIIVDLSNSISVWSANMETELRSFENDSPVIEAAVTPDGLRLVAISLGGSMRVWDIETGETLREMQVDNASRIAVMPDGKRVVCGSRDGSLVMWDIEPGEQLFDLEGHVHPISAIAIIDDGRQVVTTSLGGKIRAWDLETREQVIVERGDKSSYVALAVAPDGRTLATTSADKVVRLWDRATLIRSPQVEKPNEHYRLVIKPSSDDVSVGERLLVNVSLITSQPGAGAFELPADLASLSCFITFDKRDFFIKGSEAAIIRSDSETGQFIPVTFELQAYLPGSRSYSIQLVAEDSTSGQRRIYDAKREIKITSFQAGQARPDMLTSLEVRVAPQPDFVLHVETELEGENGPRELRYRLSSRLPNLSLRNEPVGKALLDAGEIDRFRLLLASALRPAVGLRPEDMRQRLISLGTYFFDRLFPTETAAAFHEAYWKAADQLTTWLVVDDGVSWLPWELLVPHRKDSQPPLRFLCERFQISRWVELGPALYGEVPLGEIALAHYKLQRNGEENEQVAEWKSLLNVVGAGGVAEIVGHERPCYRLHLLGQAGTQGCKRQELVARNDSSGPPSAARDANLARLDLRLKRPVISLSILSPPTARTELDDDWPLPDRVMPFLRAGASAVIGPWWPTSERADRIFWVNFYDLLERRVPLGEAVWRARHFVERALPHRPDWLAYTLFGDPRARAYDPEPSEGYTTLERLYSSQPVHAGEACYFSARISSRPSFDYLDRLVHTDASGLPRDPKAIFLARGLQDEIPEPIEMKRIGRTTMEAVYKLTPRTAGDFVLVARLYDGEERLQTLQLPLVIEKA